MAQTWHDLLFAHWPVPIAAIRPLVPPALPLDTFGGCAWIAVVPFHMSGVRLRGTPALPWIGAFPELNVRTYVLGQDKPGVYFFSLDAGNPVMVAVARRWFSLPYFRADMAVAQEGSDVCYRSRRTHPGAPRAEFAGRYRPIGAAASSEVGSLERWLTERYCLYTLDSRGRVHRAEIHHPRWPLQPAEADIAVNTMTRSQGIALPETTPLLHFSRRLDVVVWPLERLG